MVIDSSVISGAVSSFKDFLSSHSSLKENDLTIHIKEDMRHFLRIVKYLEDPALKELHIELHDALEELYQVIVIELNAVDIENFAKRKENNKKSTNDKNLNNSFKNSIVVTKVTAK